MGMGEPRCNPLLTSPPGGQVYHAMVRLGGERLELREESEVVAAAF